MRLTSVSSIDFSIVIDEHIPLDLSSMISATHLDSIKLHIEGMEWIESHTEWLNRRYKDVLEQLSTIRNLRSIMYSMSAGRILRGQWAAVLLLPVHTLRIQMTSKLQHDTTIDHIDMSTPSSNYSLRCVTLALVRRKSARCRHYASQSI
jgi:hypothetical protein